MLGRCLLLIGTDGRLVEDLGQAAGYLLGFLFSGLTRGVCLLVCPGPVGFPVARVSVLPPALEVETGGGGWCGAVCAVFPCSGPAGFRIFPEPRVYSGLPVPAFCRLQGLRWGLLMAGLLLGRHVNSACCQRRVLRLFLTGAGAGSPTYALLRAVKLTATCWASRISGLHSDTGRAVSGPITILGGRALGGFLIAVLLGIHGCVGGCCW